jgi:hypothetical protein
VKQSRVKRLAIFFSSFFHSALFYHLANLSGVALAKTESCVLAGPAATREWAIKSSSQYGRRSRTARSELTQRRIVSYHLPTTLD